jgi:hypothetical protein
VSPSESSRLSLSTAGSSMNAAFGSVSAGGSGTPEFDVTQSGGGPCAFVATQFAGKPGGVAPSKFSLMVIYRQHGGGGQGSGVGVGPTAANASIRQILSSRGIDPTSSVAREEQITATRAIPAATNGSKRSQARNRDRVDMLSKSLIIERSGTVL